MASQSVALSTSPAVVIALASGWESTELTKAWERAVQLEAMGKVNELFPNATRSTAAVEIVIEPTDEGEAAADFGPPFMEVHGGDDEAGPDLLE